MSHEMSYMGPRGEFHTKPSVRAPMRPKLPDTCESAHSLQSWAEQRCRRGIWPSSKPCQTGRRETWILFREGTPPIKTKTLSVPPSRTQLSSMNWSKSPPKNSLEKPTRMAMAHWRRSSPKRVKLMVVRWRSSIGRHQSLFSGKTMPTDVWLRTPSIYTGNT